MKFILWIVSWLHRIELISMHKSGRTWVDDIWIAVPSEYEIDDDIRRVLTCIFCFQTLGVFVELCFKLIQECTNRIIAKKLENCMKVSWKTLHLLSVFIRKFPNQILESMLRRLSFISNTVFTVVYALLVCGWGSKQMYEDYSIFWDELGHWPNPFKLSIVKHIPNGWKNGQIHVIITFRLQCWKCVR